MSQFSFFRACATILFFLQCFIAFTSAHMVMSEPPPINYKTNPFYNPAKADFDYTAPLSPSGSNYPCKGHLKDLNGPEGGSVRDYAPGGTYDLKIEGSAAHNGGSCQASLSFDGGNSWTVIKSWIGDCPHATGSDQNFKFTIPGGTPAGKAIFGWTWFNQVGNREMYMNCAVVTITGGRRKNKPKRALSGPQVFVANVGNGCTTAAGTDVVFPDAGQEIQYSGDPGKRAPPGGACGATGNYKGGGAVGSGSLGGGTGGTGATGGAGGYGGGATGGPTVNDGQGGKGCDYWRTQGYICSDGQKTQPPWTTWGWIVVVVAWALPMW
ncbi:hypothetical protein FPQ18DRAFT_14785 [Pyronema domesticum]|uniref:Uncharacterized protein n=1 Tax=Pyronema omphalodes (strain CBS 100304) TaxID=1076935 RepID=U4L6D9_PYROM|nr:hypothetical protein FPQ18DRAFT_14785 [Pyronema domesticum]CCX07996.1 Similar to hypothetical protein [Tuber melanosporum Mel28]; acc. no. XP_002835569 [Pyronema omphalodes CBS 100304]